MLIGLGNMLKNILPIKRILSAFRFAAYRKMKRAHFAVQNVPF